MQVNEKDQIGAQINRLRGGPRLFDLHNEVGLAPDLGSVLHNPGPGLHVLAIRDGAAVAGPGFDQYLMTRLTKRDDPAGHEPNARFVVLNLFRNSDDHNRNLILASSIWPGSGAAGVLS